MKISVTAKDIATLLDQAPAGVDILSLDCFDTLLWRNAQAPSDIFVELGIEGGSIEPRVFAERKARKMAAHRHGRNEQHMTRPKCALGGRVFVQHTLLSRKRKVTRSDGDREQHAGDGPQVIEPVPGCQEPLVSQVRKGLQQIAQCHHRGRSGERGIQKTPAHRP